jgi:murein tripeptide amidase MpaA
MVLRVTTADRAQLETLFEHVTGVWSCHIGPGEVDVQVTASQQAEVAALGYPWRVLIPDVQGLIDAERAQIEAAHRQRDAAWFTTYRTRTEINDRLDASAAAYPGFVTLFSAGNSVEGRPIRGLRITAPDLPGNPRATRPAAFFHGAQHAREWISPMVCMWIADQLLERYATDARVRDIVDHAEIIIIPVMNVDGYEYTWTPNNRLWRKNRRDNGNGTFGVDNNRNWGYQWGGEGASTATNNETYRGPSAFSEPETQALRDFMTANPRIRAHIDFHSYSQLVLTPWGYTAALPPEATLFEEVYGAMESSIEAVHGMNYTAGPTYTTIYPASGVSLDWSFGALGVLGTSIELRDTGQTGFILPADQIIPTGEENFEGAMALVEYARRPLWWSLPAPLPTGVDQAGAPVTVTVRSGGAALAGPPVLMARVGDGAFTPASTTPGANNAYTGVLPGATCGQAVQFYFEASTTTGITSRFPANAPAAVFAAVGQGTPIVRFSDDMETDRGWTVGAPGDAATTGLWERADPQGTAAQPEDDHTPPPGVRCWVTGAAAGANVGANDVDGGATTLTSPIIDALPPRFTAVTETRLTYARWYSNNQGSNPNQDSMPVLVSNDGGATWVQIEDVTENAGGWVVKSWRLEDFLPVTGRMRVRFVARDLGAGSVVEAAVDDVSITLMACRPDLDLNRDGNADQDDVAYLINVISGGGNPTGIDPDFNGDGNVDQDDVADFITALSGG